MSLSIFTNAKDNVIGNQSQVLCIASIQTQYSAYKLYHVIDKFVVLRGPSENYSDFNFQVCAAAGDCGLDVFMYYSGQN